MFNFDNVVHDRQQIGNLNSKSTAHVVSIISPASSDYLYFIFEQVGGHAVASCRLDGFDCGNINVTIELIGDARCSYGVKLLWLNR